MEIKLINGYHVLYPGKIISLGKHYSIRCLDQLEYDPNINYPEESELDDSIGTWYTMRWFSESIWNKYKLTPEEYHGIVVYGDKDYKYRCPGPGCTKYTNFYSIRSGWGDFCSQECKSKWYWNNPEFRSKMEDIMSSEEFSKKMSDSKKENWKDPEYRKLVSESHKAVQNTPEWKQMVSEQMTKLWSDPETGYKRAADIAYGSAESIINSYNYKTYQIYGILFEDKFKIGVTFDFEDYRAHGLSDIGYKIKDYILFEGDPYEVIKFEYEFKMKYKEYSLALNNYTTCDYMGWSEVFLISDFKFILEMSKFYQSLKQLK